MPTKRQRTNITLDGELLEVYQKLADVRGIPRATLITEYLEALKPHAKKMTKLIEAVQTNEADAQKIMMNMLADAQEEYAKSLREITNK